MLKNFNYNLIETISIISRSLYRYDKYMEDAAGCDNCQKIWLQLKESRQRELSQLLKELKIHIDSGQLELE
ncbi:MAG: hypothetical protein ACLFV2_03540 [Desulfurivibrionaceae bacterium]